MVETCDGTSCTEACDAATMRRGELCGGAVGISWCCEGGGCLSKKRWRPSANRDGLHLYVCMGELVRYVAHLKQQSSVELKSLLRNSAEDTRIRIV